MDTKAEGMQGTLRRPRGPLIGELRLSRLRQPRGTTLAMVLLAVVFLAFGVFANAVEPTSLPGAMPAPNTVDGAMHLITGWVLS